MAVALHHEEIFNSNHSVVRIPGDYFFRSFSLIIEIIKESKDMRNTENPITNDIASKAFIPATSFLFCIRDAEMTYHPITSFNPLKICIELTLFYHLYFAIKTG